MVTDPQDKAQLARFQDIVVRTIAYGRDHGYRTIWLGTVDADDVAIGEALHDLFTWRPDDRDTRIARKSLINRLGNYGIKEINFHDRTQSMLRVLERGEGSTDRMPNAPSAPRTQRQTPQR
jgi:hypothetical protein